MNPLFALIFSISFFGFWLVQKDKTHVLGVSAAYLAFACGIFISNIAITTQSAWHVLGTHVFYSMACFALVWSVCKRAGQEVDKLFSIAVLAGVAPILIWIHSISGLANMRIILANAAYAVILFMGAARLWHSRHHHPLEYLLFIVFGLMALQFLVRPFTVLAFEGELLNSDYRNSIYYLSLNVILALAALLLAISMIAVFGMDYVRENSRTPNKAGTKKTEVSDEEKIARLKSIMETNIHREHDLDVSTLADKSGIHEYQLRSLINQSMGYRNFREFLNSYRLKEVQSALSDPMFDAAPITTIAFDSGFNSIPSFNRVFKAEFGVAPTEYRDRQIATRQTA
ncbi:MAG: AraC family transcriptional regulator [Parasphingorhabdus sp.]|uniref:AraC family transcriptional regulator n=1 Tax=Parasphingorhabdus sp. TaxID=2709688 RepID=UPI0032654A48